jgi:adenylate kinase family enzyme
MKKIVIVGCPSTGKTTLANKLGLLLNIPVFHLDKIFWVQKGGIKQDVFIAQQEEIMKNDKWIIDGDFIKSKSFELRLNKADTIILLKFSKIKIYYRLLKRAIKYFNKTRPDMAGDSKKHINWPLLKLIWNYPTDDIYKKVIEYSKDKNVIVLSNFKEEKDFLNNIN